MEKHTKKLTKEDIKGPDAFVTAMDKAWIVFEKYRQLILIGLIAILAAGAGYSIFNLYQSKKEAAAQVDYYLAKKSLMDLEKSFLPKPPEPKKSVAKDAKPEPPEEAKQKTGDLDKDFGVAVVKLEDILKKHPGTKASAIASLDLAPLYLEYQKADRAQTALQQATKSVSKSDLLYGFVFLQLGNAQEAAGSCEEALKSWKIVSDSKNHAFLHSEALLNQGLCLEKMGQKDKASELYRKVSQDFGDTDAGKSAKTYLRLLNEKT